MNGAGAGVGAADVYVSVPDPLELHYFICLAILTICKEPLEELDQSEVRSMLLSLPAMDVDRVSTLTRCVPAACASCADAAGLLPPPQLLVEATNLRTAYQRSKPPTK